MPDSSTRLAPAKLNLALHVTGRRDAGYHLIDSLVAFADVGDLVTVSPADCDSLIVTGHYAPMVPIDSGNLVVAARDLLRRQFRDGTLPGVKIALEKRLPVASGIGGGSSDAAATVKALTELWGITPDFDQFAEAALPLGADIPMCLAERPLLAGGIGDVIKPLSSFPAVDAILVNPGLPVSTPAVFKALHKRDNAPLPCPPAVRNAAGLADYLAGTRNDLQETAIAQCPMIADALDALVAGGALLARMSGSGATCFGLFRSRVSAEAAANSIRERHPSWFVQKCRIRGTEGTNGRN